MPSSLGCHLREGGSPIGRSDTILSPMVPVAPFSSEGDETGKGPPPPSLTAHPPRHRPPSCCHTSVSIPAKCGQTCGQDTHAHILPIGTGEHDLRCLLSSPLQSQSPFPASPAVPPAPEPSPGTAGPAPWPRILASGVCLTQGSHTRGNAMFHCCSHLQRNPGAGSEHWNESPGPWVCPSQDPTCCVACGKSCQRPAPHSIYPLLGANSAQFLALRIKKPSGRGVSPHPCYISRLRPKTRPSPPFLEVHTNVDKETPDGKREERGARTENTDHTDPIWALKARFQAPYQLHPDLKPGLAAGLPAPPTPRSCRRGNNSSSSRTLAQEPGQGHRS